MALVRIFQLRSSEESNLRSTIAVISCQHILLWSSVYIIASTIYLFAIGAIDIVVLPAAVALIFCAVISIVYICFHNAAALLQRDLRTQRKKQRNLLFEWLAKMVVRFLITIWMLGCGVAIAFTIAKHPNCTFWKQPVNLTPIEVGSTCAVQRLGVGMSLLCLCVSIGLFILQIKSSDTFRCHLFGIVQRSNVLFLQPPYPILKRSKNSEGSFKCRTSASLESDRTTFPCATTPPPLPPQTQQMHKLSSLLPTRPDSGSFGLGIYSQKREQKHQQQQTQPPQPKFLTPRPSLQSIRSSASLPHPPSSLPADPVPPLPAYLPHSYKRTPAAILTAVHPPRRPCRPEHKANEKSLRVLASLTQPPQHTNSFNSLTSMYSQTSTGERTGGLAPRPGRLSLLPRSLSDENTPALHQQYRQNSATRSELPGASRSIRHHAMPSESAIGIALDGFEQVRTVGGHGSSSARSLRYFDRSKSESNVYGVL